MSAQGLPAARQLAQRHRVRWWEGLPWLIGIIAFFLFPNHLGFATQVLITILSR